MVQCTCSPSREHISLVISITLPGKYISLVKCVPLPLELKQYVWGKGEHMAFLENISPEICVPRVGEHTSPGIFCFLGRGRDSTSDECSPTWETHILSEMSSFTRET